MAILRVLEAWPAEGRLLPTTTTAAAAAATTTTTTTTGDGHDDRKERVVATLGFVKHLLDRLHTTLAPLLLEEEEAAEGPNP